MVTHIPPVSTTIDLLINGKHIGSSATHNFTVEYQMDLCIAGYIHEANKRELIRKTVVYNPGMFCDGGWLEIHINKSERETTLHEQP